MTSPDYYFSPLPSEDYSYIDSADAGPQLHFLTNKVLVFAIIALFWIIVLLATLHIYGRWLCMSRNRNSRSNAIRPQNQDLATSAGLSKAAIAQLPTFTYTAPAMSDPGTCESAELLECAVCLSEFQENEKGRLLPSCKHSFHIECIDMWFYSHSTCPICRAIVMPTITTSDLMPITVTTHEQQQEGEEEAHITRETTPSAHDDNPLSASAIPDGSDLAHAVQIPTNVLFCANSTQLLLPSQLGSSQSSERPSPSSSAKPKRCIPHITIEIPTCQDINLIPSPGCLSLTSRRSRCASPRDAGCSSRTPLKSPGLRESLKRMLNGQSSEGRRVFTSCNQEGSMESPKGTGRLQVEL